MGDHRRAACRPANKSLDRAEKNDYYTKDFMSSAEDTYLTHKGKLLDLERSLQPKSDEGKGSVESAPPAAPSRRTVLPKIKLPEFSGKYEDWPAFRDHFVAIDSDELLPTVEKLHYLRSCVQGEAATLIQNLSATAANYKRAWEELSGFYENTRILVRSYLSNFLKLPKMKHESASELKKIFHGIITTYDSLENLGRPVSESEDLFVHLIVELLSPRTRDLWDELTSESSEPPSFDKLKAFLQRRLQTLDGRIAGKEASTNTSAGKSSSGTKSAKSHVAQKRETKGGSKAERCSFCSKDHFLMFCEGFKGKSAAEKKEHVSGKHLCLNCLGKHKTNDCSSKKACTVCNERYHTLLHDAYREQKMEKNEATTSHAVSNRCAKPLTILLATARVRVTDRFGILHYARALIDQGSETSFISEALAQKLKLPRRHASVTVIGVGGNQTGVARGRVTIKIMPHFKEAGLTVSALVLPKLTEYTGAVNVTARPWTHLENLELADPHFLESDQINLLLGADVFAAILQAGLKKGEAHEPIAQQTSLGWIISGGISTPTDNSDRAVAHQCITTEDLGELVKKFWSQEEVPMTTSPQTEAEQRCEELFVKTHTRTAEGRYVVRLPLAQELPDLSSTRYAAARSLISMERRFARDARLRKLYHEFMTQYEELNHMSPTVTSKNKIEKNACYLPHHGVLRESSVTTKLRVVFNGSQNRFW